MAGEKILIVDDDPGQRLLLGTALRKAGYAILEAGNGVDAVDAAFAERPGLLLLDLGLPEMDGYDVGRRLRADPRTRLLPILVVTARQTLPEKLRALECGVDEVIVKPVVLPELLARVRSVLSLRRNILEVENATTVLQAVARVVERRDAYTADHGGRVSEISRRIGQALGLPEEELDILSLGASLHDVGKIGIPDAILLKPGKLSPEEYDVMKTHPAIGAELCGPMKSMARALPLIRHHHEKLDGSGYPDGLRGAGIPVLVRVLSVADVFDALSSARRYRGQLPNGKALQILREEAARGWWDAGVVEIWERLCLKEAERRA